MPYEPSRRRDQPSPGERAWVFSGAVVLAGVAGFINVVVLGYFAVPVSHMTGAVSRLGSDAALGRMEDFLAILSIVGGFLIGAFASGLIIGGRKLRPGRRYGVALLFEGVTLVIATALLRADQQLGLALAAAACGMQNAMASSYYGLVIRTTHVTGIVTDIGVMLGHWVRHRRIRTWKLSLLVSILTAFMAGGVVGARAFLLLGVSALGVAAWGCIVAGGMYYVWRHAEAVAVPASTETRRRRPDQRRR